MSDASLTAQLQAGATPSGPPAAATGAALWSKGGFGFKDLLDIVNPLQHLPVIGSIYRYVTGDEPSGGASIVGDTLYGGPIGLGIGVVGSMLTDSQGRDLGERLLAAVFSPSGGSPAPGKPILAAVPAPPVTATLAASPQSAPAPGSAAEVQAATQFARGLYRSPPPAATPEQSFLAQNAQLQRPFAATQAHTTRRVPLELTSNLLSIARPSATYRPAAAPPPGTAPGAPVPSGAGIAASNGDASTNPIAQKMRDALDKYDQLKKQQSQDGSTPIPASAPVDLSM